MNPTSFTMTPDAYNAHLLDGVMDITTPPNEAPEAGAKRQASIVEMFRAYDPSTAVEATIACHCITWEFVLRGAMRDAANTALDPKLLIRMRSQANTISRTLHMWMTKYETVKARNEKRAVEAAKQIEAAPPTAETPAPPPPVRPEPPGPVSVRPGPAATLRPGLAAKEALVAGANANGRAHGPEGQANTR